MWWIIFIAIQGVYLGTGIRREQRAGLWSWSKFFFSLAFVAVEVLIIVVPLTWADTHRRYFVPVTIVASTVAVANFIWFIIAARRWKLPDGRSSLQAYRDEHRS